MKKEKFHVLIITNSIKEEYNLLGEYDRNNKLIEFYESNKLRSKITIDLTKHLLIKDNIDYRITLDLNINKRTKGEILLKRENGVVNIEVDTKNFTITDNKLSMRYIISDSNEEVIYEIEMGD